MKKMHLTISKKLLK